MKKQEDTMSSELLAPAGDWDALRAAVANGADAVYFGLDHFNARHRAKNFSLEELPKVMDFLHAHNVKGFVTFNTLIFSDELAEAAEYVGNIARAGVDAVLVQDLGVCRMVHQMVPTLVIHGSTQMTLTEPRGMEFVKDLGVKRVVLARELSVTDIGLIAEGVKGAVELEVFVHGALCVAYSGQCLTSESLGGRSANRGQCAQACRLPYQLVVDGAVKDLGDKQYLLSPSDLAAYDVIGELMKLGVACFKIEGRLKSAHYVAATTQTYRAAMDAAAGAKPFVITAQQKLELEQSFSRGFTPGFLEGANHQRLVSARYSGARGTRVGTVVAVAERGIVVELDGGNAKCEVRNAKVEQPLKPGDGVVFDEGHPEQDEQGGRVFEVRPAGAGRVEIGLGYGDVNLSYINPGAIVWKTDDPQLKKRLEHSFARDVVAHRVAVDFVLRARVGEHLQVEARAEGRSATAEYSEKVLEAARKFPFSAEVAQEQLSRLGDTPYELGKVTLDVAGGPMVPKSVLNDLRRECVEGLLRQRGRGHEIADGGALATLRAEAAALRARERSDSPRLHVLVRTMEQLDAVLAYTGTVKPTWVYADFEDVRRYKEAVAKCRAAGMPIGLATLRIVKPHEEGLLKQIAECGPDALVVRNLAALSYYREKYPELAQIGDYALNVANELTAAILAEAGLVRMVPSYDLNWKQLSAMLSRMDAGLFECVIHQHMPMFHMEHCVFAHTLSTGKDYRDCGRPCDRHKVDLTDRVGAAHPLIPDVGCRNTVFNALGQTAADLYPEMVKLGVRHFRVEMLREDGAGAAKLVDQYARLIAGETQPRVMMRSLRVLQQLGVTPGALVGE